MQLSQFFYPANQDSQRSQGTQDTQRRQGTQGSQRSLLRFGALLLASFREHAINREMHFIEETVCLKAHFLQRAIDTFCKNSKNSVKTTNKCSPQALTLCDSVLT